MIIKNIDNLISAQFFLIKKTYLTNVKLTNCLKIANKQLHT
jgi:hypothetical protein